MSADHEWDATIRVLAYLDSIRPAGLPLGGVMVRVNGERHSIAWDELYDALGPASRGERILLDVAYSLWSGNNRCAFEDGRPLASLADVWSTLSDTPFRVVLDGLMIRRGMAVLS